MRRWRPGRFVWWWSIVGSSRNLTAASVAVAKQLGVGKESVRRWVLRPTWMPVVVRHHD